MTAPTIILICLVALYPVLRTFYLSFTNARLSSARAVSFVGISNYTDLLTDRTFLQATYNTAIFTIISVAFETVLGLIVALTIHSNFKGRGLVRTAMLIPWAIPTVVSARMWAWMYNDVFGVINDLLVTRLGVLDHKLAWVADPVLTLPSLIAIDVWKTTPFMALLLLAGLQVIPDDIYEAADIDGASKWQQFWTMTLPMLRPALVVALIFRTLDAFRVFDLPFVVKGTAPESITLSILARQTMIDLARLGQGAALAVVIFIFLMIIVAVYVRLVRVEVE
ncbi:MAG TPA: sugar ABC transporter permease [Kouleothrix sp.]|uniref:carbohydrate ABC transporter permease n=1 Tax=Kouleothrix sp. TaxID=2779161 RepID=UPI002B8C811D|nr:sugar ABC transporter permease [Kouleothrix sp.]